MIGSQSVKAIKLSGFARNSLRHALSSSSHSNARSNSTSNAVSGNNSNNNTNSNNGDFFTSSPAPPTPDYSQAFFTSAPAPSAGSTLTHGQSYYWDPSEQRAEGRAGKGQQRGKNSAGSGWNFQSSGRVAAGQIQSGPALDAGLLIRHDEEDESHLPQVPRRPSVSARPRSSSSTVTLSNAASPTTSSALLQFANSRQAFQVSMREAFMDSSPQQRLFGNQAWLVRPSKKQTLRIQGYASESEAQAAAAQSEDGIVVTAQAQAEGGATIEELPTEEEQQATKQSQQHNAAQNAKAPKSTRNRVRSSSLPSRLSKQSQPREGPVPSEASREHLEAIQRASSEGSASDVSRAVERYRESGDYSLQTHNAALSALAQWHVYSEPLHSFLDLFQEMLTFNLRPSVATYGTVIEALAQRDGYVQVRLDRIRSELAQMQRAAAAEAEEKEIHQGPLVSETTSTNKNLATSPAASLGQQDPGQQRNRPDSPPTASASSSTSAEYKLLEQEQSSLSLDDSCTAAFQIYKAIASSSEFPVSSLLHLPQSTIHALLRLCIRHKRNRDAVAILHQSQRALPEILDFEAIALTIRASAEVNDFAGATRVFQDYLQSAGLNQSSSSISSPVPASVRSDAELLVWDEMIGASFQSGNAHAAVSTFDQLIQPSLGLQPDVRLLERMVSGFALIGDGSSALRWAERITSDPHFAQSGLPPVFLSRSITLLASRISSMDIVSASDACGLYTIMRNFANETNQAYSGASLQQLITAIVPYTFSAERTPLIQDLYDRLALFVEQFSEDVAKQRPSINSYIAPEALALLDKARKTSYDAQSASREDVSADAHTQAARESIAGSHSAETVSDPVDGAAFSPGSMASTAGTPPADEDAHKSLDSSLPIVRPLTPANAYAGSSSFEVPSTPTEWDEQISADVQAIFENTKVYDLAGAQAGYLIITAAAQNRFVPTDMVADALARCGHAQDPTMVEQLYLVGYTTLNFLESDPPAQLAGWHKLENAALIAAANAGMLDKAAVHRDRLIEAGGAPSAEAYGTLILNAKDTTDDASVAIELFEESRRLGVVPNTFLFNNLISRLSKARRTKAVLECFEQMKAAGIPTSSVTYGAVINACCKIGDVSAAAFLFEEMTSLIDFVPKVPPYNTMIQFFVSTKPDRERALYYYQRMLKAGVRPSGHTYKLLLDCYGALQPVDEKSMRDVFKALERDHFVDVEGTHWAALINSYGLTQNNLDKAIETFESIASHPKNAKASRLPDAVTYEAILNSCLANNRPDLVEYFAKQMRDKSVHSTAYCENARIKAFAKQGNLEGARQVFQGLTDPPTGVAASGNHPGGRRHIRTRKQARKNGEPDAVYREPSSFEAMIRAEVKMGDLAVAASLVELARQRAFPAQVIKGLEDQLTVGPQ